MPNKTAIAMFAHPDDIEFRAAGTLLLLREAGLDIHTMNVASGNCGSMSLPAEDIAAIRAKEAQTAASILDATWHPSIANDLEITYDIRLIRKITAVMREVNPSIVLTHAPEDYMEDHMITSRLVVTAAFSKGIPNFVSDPVSKAASGDVAIYHAMPHGLHDQLRRPVVPDIYVNTTSVHGRKREALAAHASQKDWLDATQGMDSYLQAMDDESIALGNLSGTYQHAEGWCRHSHLGFSASDTDPLAALLGDQVLTRSTECTVHFKSNCTGQ